MIKVQGPTIIIIIKFVSTQQQGSLADRLYCQGRTTDKIIKPLGTLFRKHTRTRHPGTALLCPSSAPIRPSARRPTRSARIQLVLQRRRTVLSPLSLPPFSDGPLIASYPCSAGPLRWPASRFVYLTSPAGPSARPFHLTPPRVPLAWKNILTIYLHVFFAVDVFVAHFISATCFKWTFLSVIIRSHVDSSFRSLDTKGRHEWQRIAWADCKDNKRCSSFETCKGNFTLVTPEIITHFLYSRRISASFEQG